MKPTTHTMDKVVRRFLVVLSIAFPCVLLSLALGTTLPLFAETLNYPDQLLSQDFLRARVWKADKGVEALVRDWVPYSDSQGFEDRTIVSSAIVKLLGINFRAEYRLFKPDSVGEILVLHNDDYNEKLCASLISLFSNRLGKPRIILDRSTAAAGNGFYRNTADWLLGQTRSN